MLVVTPKTVLNPVVLETTVVPRKFFGRALPRPSRAPASLRLRLLVEIQFLRFMVALVPFCIPMLIWPQSAAPISQAPLAMLVLIGISETYVLRLTQGQRTRLMSEAEAETIQDNLRFRGQAALRKIAARKGIENGQIKLVVEQSDLARITPLTFVSVQAEAPKPHVLTLDEGDREALDNLFDDELSERELHRSALRLGRMLQVIALETRSVSAHARLAAALEKRAHQAARGTAPAPSDSSGVMDA